MTGIKKFEGYEAELREKYGKPGVALTVSGLSGVGKSTLSDFLADELDLSIASAGRFFREEADKRDMNIVEFTEKVEEIGSREGVDFDIKWEKRSLELPFKKDRVLVQGRVSGVTVAGRFGLRGNDSPGRKR